LQRVQAYVPSLDALIWTDRKNQSIYCYEQRVVLNLAGLRVGYARKKELPIGVAYIYPTWERSRKEEMRMDFLACLQNY
jgi:hypothetical protein